MDGGVSVKYRNIETGVILEPATPVAEAGLSQDDRYVVVVDTPPKKPKAETKTEG